jgi:hypothetical protein
MIASSRSARDIDPPIRRLRLGQNNLNRSSDVCFLGNARKPFRYLRHQEVDATRAIDRNASALAGGTSWAPTAILHRSYRLTEATLQAEARLRAAITAARNWALARIATGACNFARRLA